MRNYKLDGLTEIEFKSIENFEKKTGLSIYFEYLEMKKNVENKSSGISLKEFLKKNEEKKLITDLVFNFTAFYQRSFSSYIRSETDYSDKEIQEKFERVFEPEKTGYYPFIRTNKKH